MTKHTKKPRINSLDDEKCVHCGLGLCGCDNPYTPEKKLLCPKCKSKMKKTSTGWLCSGRDTCTYVRHPIIRKKLVITITNGFTDKVEKREVTEQDIIEWLKTHKLKHPNKFLFEFLSSQTNLTQEQINRI